VGADPCRIRFGYWIERVRAGEDVVVTRRGRPIIRLTAAAPIPASEPGRAAPAPSFVSATTAEPA
jgi:prevent-host-death family protein